MPLPGNSSGSPGDYRAPGRGKIPEKHPDSIGGCPAFSHAPERKKAKGKPIGLPFAKFI
jgi:hypothetical protein